MLRSEQTMLPVPTLLLFLVLVFVLLLGSPFLSAPGAQDWLLSPSYGEVELYAGFTEDPWTVELVAGGSADISHLGYRGRVAEEPDFDLWYEAGTFPLTFRVDAARASTILLINDPQGRWHYSDGTGLGSDPQNNPRIVFRNPSSGLYNVWVGTARNEYIPARLLITEY